MYHVVSRTRSSKHPSQSSIVSRARRLSAAPRSEVAAWQHTDHIQHPERGVPEGNCRDQDVQAEHQRAYAAAIDGKPGGMDAVMWANYRAHEAAEAKVGK